MTADAVANADAAVAGYDTASSILVRSRYVVSTPSKTHVGGILGVIASTTAVGALLTASFALTSASVAAGDLVASSTSIYGASHSSNVRIWTTESELLDALGVAPVRSYRIKARIRSVTHPIPGVRDTGED